jgi:hypothetical protein
MGAAGEDQAAVYPRVPITARIAFAHAAVQWLADSSGLDILHVKGAAFDPAPAPRRSYTDADVLVRPSHVMPMLRDLRRHGWVIVNSFAYGSSFEHSATLRHPDFGMLDLHRVFPGIGPTPEAAFDCLWHNGGMVELGGIPCRVPAPAAHSVLLLVHAARGGREPRAANDIERLWTGASEEERAEIAQWVDRLGARLAFSVITGTLDEHRDDPSYDLWRVASRGGTRVEEWLARVRAAPSLSAKVRTALRSVVVNTEHLAIVRGRPVSRQEVVAEFFARPIRGVREQVYRKRSGQRADGER